ncbi:MAG: molybdopterin-dependent oxidoreductase [Deltaproteobacteria bacterium]|nr:molybdopterin-dependent oxidoreductase [Deltaproteobacteria bacterium]
MSEQPADGFSRRDFIKCSAILGGAFWASQLEGVFDLIQRAEAGTLTPEEDYELKKTENILYTVCMQCNTGCGIKVKMYRQNGKAYAVKIDGSAYSPWLSVPHASYRTSPFDLAKEDLSICPKGHAGLQAAYDPYRVVKVLKRAGRRGENQWRTIPFPQAIDEIVNGGKLFSHVPGEENRVVTGLQEIYALRDPRVMKDMAEDARALQKAQDKKAAVAAFKVKHAANLKDLIDPDHPDLGPKNNHFVYMWGRKKGGRGDFSARFFGDYFGTVNTHGHTTVCQGSLYFASKACSEQYQGNRFGGGSKFYWQGDIENSKYILFVGANLFDANYGPTNRTVRLSPRLTDGEVRIAVADPRFSKLASKAHKYLPVKPGTDGALFSAILQWMLKNKRYDEKYLANANLAAAKKAGEPTYANLCWLVKVDRDGRPGRFLRAQEIGLAQPEKRKDAAGKEQEFEYLVVWKGDRPEAFDPNDAGRAVTGDLLVDREIKGIRVKTGLQIMREEVNKKSFQAWAALCGLNPEDIEEVAKGLTSAGKRACVDIHRGVAQHTNGFYSILLAWAVNLLLGNFDWKGGMIVASTYGGAGGKPGQPFDLGKMAPGKLGRFGISIIRHDIKYEDSTIFSGYPAKRNWWPLASDVYEEILPSIGDAYPYPIKALFGYMCAPNYALPAGQTITAVLADLEKVPLFFVPDITIGSASLYADYLFPDLSDLERWEFHGSHPNMPARVQPIKQPVMAPITEIVKVFGEEMPCSYDALQLALAEKLGLPGYGKDGFGPGQDFNRPDDFYIRMVANFATDGTPVPDADDAELKLFLDSRKHLPRTIFDPQRWEKIAGPVWRKVVYVLNRGGRFQDYTDQYQGEQVANQYGKLFTMYQEKTAETKNAFTGKSNPGYPHYLPIFTAAGKTPEEAGLTQGFDLHLITQRDITMTKSRTISNYWLTEIYPENAVVINRMDAERLGLKPDDQVRIVSATNPDGIWDLKGGGRKDIIGKVQVTETIQPGVITFTIGHGHWATGASDIMVNGEIIPGDPKRAKGFNANAAMWIDPQLKNTCMFDPVGGSVSFYDTKVKLLKI